MDDIVIKFLRTGSLQSLVLGMTYKDVLNKIKNADSNSLKATNTRVVWWIKDLELSFFKGKLDIINVKWKDGKSQIPLELLPPDQNGTLVTTQEELLKLLDANNFQYERYVSECRENINCIKLESGIQVYFENNFVQSIVMM